MRRRKVLRKAAAGAALLVGSAFPYAVTSFLAPGKARSQRNYVRPPGALPDDDAFVSACIGCGLCGEVCPPRCILFHSRDGAGKVNTPYIDTAEKACTLCAKCMTACPTEALTEIPLKEIAMGSAQIDETACYPWVDRGICGACVTICPLGNKAISFDFANIYRPVVQKGCVGCGLCVEVCPHPSKPIWITAPVEGAGTAGRA